MGFVNVVCERGLQTWFVKYVQENKSWCHNQNGNMPSIHFLLYILLTYLPCHSTPGILVLSDHVCIIKLSLSSIVVLKDVVMTIFFEEVQSAVAQWIELCHVTQRFWVQLPQCHCVVTKDTNIIHNLLEILLMNPLCLPQFFKHSAAFWSWKNFFYE